MMNCKEITLLIEKSKEQKLTFFQRLQIKLHAKFCKVCDNYALDSAFLNRLIKKWVLQTFVWVRFFIKRLMIQLT